MTSRGSATASEHTIHRLGVYGPQIPIRITVDQYPQFRQIQSYAQSAATPNVIPVANEVDERETRRRARPSVMNSASNLTSSNPSPDEIVIKGRGRRSLPLKWSPIPMESPQKTPLSSLIRKSPRKGLITLRSSPRKRLQLTDSLSNDVIQGRKSLLSSSPMARKSIESESQSQVSSSEARLVSELSKDQLVHVLNSIMDKHPQIKDEIGTILDSNSPVRRAGRKRKTQNGHTDSNGEITNTAPSNVATTQKEETQ